MAEIVKVKVFRRGPQGAIDPADRQRFDRAVVVSETIEERQERIIQAETASTEAAASAAGDRVQTGQDRAQTGQDRTAAGEQASAARQERILAEAVAATVDSGFYRRNYVLKPTFLDGIANWISFSTAAATATHAAPYLLVTGVTTNNTNWPVISENALQRLSGLKRLKASVLASARAPLTGDNIGIRPVLRLSADGTTTGLVTTYPMSAFTYFTTEEQLIAWDIVIPDGYTHFRLDYQFSRIVSNAAQLRSVSLQNADLERAVEVARKVVNVADRAEILRSSVGDADQVYNKKTGDFFKRLPAGDSATHAPVTMADGQVLVPAWDPYMTMWDCPDDGQTTVSPDGLTVTHTGTDCWSQFVYFMRWCMAHDKTGIIPRGKFFITNKDQTAWRNIDGQNGTLNLRLKGEGMKASQILWNDYRGLNGLGRMDFLQVINLGDFTFEDFGLIGDWRKLYRTAEGAIIGGGHTFGGNFLGHGVMRNVEVSGSHFFGLALGGGRTFQASECDFNHCARDGLHANVYEHFECLSSNFYRCNDDAIASHLYEVPADRKPAVPTYQVAFNRLEQCQGIAILGAARGHVHNNIGKEIYTRWIACNSGSQLPISMNIHDNSVENIFNQIGYGSSGSGASGINIGTALINALEDVPTKGPNPDGHWDWEATGAGVAKPYARRFSGYYPDGARPHTFGISIKNNRLIRTLEFGKDWESQRTPLDKRFWTQEGPVNPTFTENNLCNEAITVSDSLVDVEIEGNHVMGFKRPLSIGTEPARVGALPQPNRSLHRVAVRHNTFVGWRTTAAQVLGSGVVTFQGNIFDGDPLFENPDHAANGTWGSANIATHPCVAVTVPETTHAGMVPTIIFQGNELANLRSPFSRVIEAVLGDNILRGDFVGQSNAGNKGIRDMQYHPNRLGTLIYEGSDATDVAGFLKVKQVNRRVQDAMPTSGHWISGTIVDLAMPVPSGADLIMGYVRLTTGTGHVPGTDWRAVTLKAA